MVTIGILRNEKGFMTTFERRFEKLSDEGLLKLLVGIRDLRKDGLLSDDDLNSLYSSASPVLSLQAVSNIYADNKSGLAKATIESNKAQYLRVIDEANDLFVKGNLTYQSERFLLDKLKLIAGSNTVAAN